MIPHRNLIKFRDSCVRLKCDLLLSQMSQNSVEEQSVISGQPQAKEFKM